MVEDRHGNPTELLIDNKKHYNILRDIIRYLELAKRQFINKQMHK